MAAAAGPGPGAATTADALSQQLQQDIATRLGFAVQPVWLQQIVSQLNQQHAGYNQQPRSVQLQLLLEQLLMADFRQAGAGGLLPADVKVLLL